MYPSWQSKKSALGHDWLRHSFLPSIANYMNILSGQVLDDNLDSNMGLDMLRTWDNRFPEILMLLETFPKEMSPVLFFRRPPLARCAEETKNWLSEVVHTYWLNRIKAKQLLKAGREASEAADMACNALKQALGDGPQRPQAKVQSHAQLWQEFYLRCQELADVLSSFPRSIKVG